VTFEIFIIQWYTILQLFRLPPQHRQLPRARVSVSDGSLCAGPAAVALESILGHYLARSSTRILILAVIEDPIEPQRPRNVSSRPDIRSV
jgi:hypothetical protein